jgi:hypothetical protein
MFSGTINQVFNTKAVADTSVVRQAHQPGEVNKNCKIPGVAVYAVVCLKAKSTRHDCFKLE